MCEVDFIYHINIHLSDLFDLIAEIEENQRCDEYIMHLHSEKIEVNINSTIFTLYDLDIENSECCHVYNQHMPSNSEDECEIIIDTNSLDNVLGSLK